MRLCMEGSCAEVSSAEEKVEDVMRKVKVLAMPPCRGDAMGIHTSQSTGGVIESHNFVRSITRRGGYLSEPGENPPFLN